MGTAEHPNPAWHLQRSMPNHLEQAQHRCIQALQLILPVMLVLHGQKGWQVAADCA